MTDFETELTYFNPISLKQMDRVKLMNRVDTKFAFSIKQFHKILHELKDYYDILEIENTRTPFYESLYFDEADFKFFQDHHNGKTDRFKVRFRKYVESNLFFLEIKHKIKGRTDKTRIQVESIPKNLSDEHLAFINENIPELKNLEAKMWNSFHRITLVNKSENERLTLDYNLNFKWEDENIHLDNLVIAELKQESVKRNSVFYQLMKKYHIRPYRLSKYCIGSIELYGQNYLKFNRFKKKLLQLKKINEYAA